MFITDIRYSEASLPSSVTLLQSVTSFLHTGKGTTGQARQVNVTSTFPKRRYVCAAYLFTHLQIYKTFIFFFLLTTSQVSRCSRGPNSVAMSCTDGVCRAVPYRSCWQLQSVTGKLQLPFQADDAQRPTNAMLLLAKVD